VIYDLLVMLMNSSESLLSFFNPARPWYRVLDI
jgi:hypothetical protein